MKNLYEPETKAYMDKLVSATMNELGQLEDFESYGTNYGETCVTVTANLYNPREDEEQLEFKLHIPVVLPSKLPEFLSSTLVMVTVPGNSCWVQARPDAIAALVYCL